MASAPTLAAERGQKWGLAGMLLATVVLVGVIDVLYAMMLQPPMMQARAALGLDLWPAQWPTLAQVLLLYFASDFIYYWIHRAIHGSATFWRLSGHGFHHSFHNMHALNIGATHPLEMLFIALPMVLLAGLFGGRPEAMAGASVLLFVNSSLAHANVRMNTPVLRWFFTSSVHHHRHHSVVFEQSNSNYSCNAILWDRLFGTYSQGPVEQTGIGPQEPTFVQKLLLPIREPAYADTAISRAQHSSGA